MKRILLYIMVLTTTIVASAKVSDNDIIISLKSIQRMTITENTSGVKVIVTENDTDSTILNYEYMPDAVIKTTQSQSLFTIGQSSIRIGGLGFGFVNALNESEGMNVETGKSFELMLMNALSYQYRTGRYNDYFNVGVGVDWKNFKMGDIQRFVYNDGCVTIGDYPEGCVAKSSRLKVFSVLFPAYYNFSMPTKFLPNLGISLGAVLNLNTHASLNTVYNLADGSKSSESVGKGLQKHLVTVDLIGMLRLFSWGGAYVKYSPCQTFKKGYGPEFTSLSTGIIFMY